MFKFLSSLFLIPLIVSCTTLPDIFVSPGRIDRKMLNDGLRPLKEVCEELKDCDFDKLEIVGHGAGSYRYYPMDVVNTFMVENTRVRGNNWSNEYPAKAKNINDLLDLTFSSNEVDSVEIDVQAAPLSHSLCGDGLGCLYVMHNEPDWEMLEEPGHNAIEYLQNNSLRKILKYFVETKKYYKDRRLHLELKSNFGCNDPDRTSDFCRESAVRLANEIITTLSNLNALKSEKWKDPETGEPVNWLSLVSFSATALQVSQEVLKAAGLDKYVDFSLIAGVYPADLRWIPGQLKGSVPVFSSKLRGFAETTEWLDTIWFSPQGIEGFNKVFQDVLNKRQAQYGDKDRLGFNIAVYSYVPSQFISEMLSMQNRGINLPVKAMMIDIDDRPVSSAK